MSIKTAFRASALITDILCQTANFHCKWIRAAAGTSSRPAVRYKAAPRKSFIPRALEVFVSEIKRLLPRLANAVRSASSHSFASSARPLPPFHRHPFLFQSTSPLARISFRSWPAHQLSSRLCRLHEKTLAKSIRRYLRSCYKVY